MSPSDAELRGMDITKLREVIDAEGLPVNKGVGRGGRTRQDVEDDVLRERRRLRGDWLVEGEAEDPWLYSGRGQHGDEDAVTGFMSMPQRCLPRNEFEVYLGGGFPVVQWCTPGGAGITQGGMQVDRIVFSKAEPKKVCFLHKLFPGRVLVGETAMPTLKEASKGSLVGVLPAKVVEASQPGGDPFHLVACRMFEGGARNMFGGKERKFHWWYVSAVSLASLEVELAGMANFAALPCPRKLAARLNMLASKEMEGNFKKLPVTAFEMVDEPMTPDGEAAQDGCGFIPHSLLTQLLRSMKSCSSSSSSGTDDRALAVQVRVLAPALGMFKGVLMGKSGIERVQLTPSMRKVPPSEHHNRELHDSAILLIKQIHPCHKNKEKGDYLKAHPGTTAVPKLKDSRPGVFEKPVPVMVQQLLKHHGLSAAQLKTYMRPCEKFQRHAFVVGVADPTGAIPEGHIFVTGLPQLESAFVTRCPCIKPSDGRVFPTLSHKPTDMSDADFRELTEMPFGAVIFSSRGAQPMPQLVADGDLDGDYYFVLWDEEVVDAVSAGAQREAAKHDGASRSVRRHEQGLPSASGMGIGDNWMTLVQAHFHDIEVVREALNVSKTYKHWEKKVEECGLDSLDARNAGRAYVRALECGKHGASGSLPSKPIVSNAPHPASGRLPSHPKSAKSSVLCPSSLRRMGATGLQRVVEENGLNVNVFDAKNQLRDKRDLAEDVIKAVKAVRKKPKVPRLEEHSDSGDEEASEAFSVCAAAANIVNKKWLLRTANGKSARFLGGHTADISMQGCVWLAICLCEECTRRPFEYIEDGGCMMTMEELYEHATGSPASETRNEWQSQFTMEDVTSGQCMPFWKWLKVESQRKYEVLKDGPLNIYWPGSKFWYTAHITKYDVETATCKLVYEEDRVREKNICLGGELVSKLDLNASVGSLQPTSIGSLRELPVPYSNARSMAPLPTRSVVTAAHHKLPTTPQSCQQSEESEQCATRGALLTLTAENICEAGGWAPDDSGRGGVIVEEPDAGLEEDKSGGRSSCCTTATKPAMPLYPEATATMTGGATGVVLPSRGQHDSERPRSALLGIRRARTISSRSIASRGSAPEGGKVLSQGALKVNPAVPFSSNLHKRKARAALEGGVEVVEEVVRGNEKGRLRAKRKSLHSAPLSSMAFSQRARPSALLVLNEGCAMIGGVLRRSDPKRGENETDIGIVSVDDGHHGDQLSERGKSRVQLSPQPNAFRL